MKVVKNSFIPKNTLQFTARRIRAIIEKNLVPTVKFGGGKIIVGVQ